jgi:hypothetical protein
VINNAISLFVVHVYAVKQCPFSVYDLLDSTPLPLICVAPSMDYLLLVLYLELV